jgi:putative ABC transport system permease protein
MLRNYFITTYRNLIKNSMFSMINILGLALGLMSCILIMLFVRDEMGYDSWLKDNERLVRLHSAFHIPNSTPFLTVNSAGKMMEALRDYAKNEIEDGVRIVNFGTTVTKDENIFSEQVSFVDGSFFNIFDLPFKHGSKNSSFTKPFDLLITEEMAIKYFGKTDVIGETLTLCCIGEEPSVVPISGVIKDLPKATHMNLDLIVYLQPSIFDSQPNMLNTFNSVNVLTYFKMRSGITVEQLQQRLNYWINNESPFVEMVNKHLGGLKEGQQITDMVNPKVMSVPDLHLRAREDAGNMGDMTPMGDLRMIYTFIIIAGLILLIACINFMNLSTARASQRAREVAMRKVLGASRSQIAVQFLSETVTLVFIALLFALVAVEAVLPFYNEILGRELELKLFDDVKLIITLLGIALFVGVGAGIYPALYLSRFMPGKVLRANNSSSASSSSNLRTLLVIFQFAISISLIISTAVVYRQALFANSLDAGFSSENKLVLNIRGAGDSLNSLKQELLNLPEISSVVYSSESPTQDNENNTGYKLLDRDSNDSSNDAQVLNYHNMGYGFFEAYDIKLLAGRFFDEAYGTDKITPIPAAKGDSDANETIGVASVILNESAIKKFGFSDAKEAIGKTLEAEVFRAGKQHLNIIGVIPDIYFRSIKFGVRATLYQLDPNRFRVASLTFKSGNIASLIGKVEAVWKNNVPQQPINLQFLSEMMKAQYESEQSQANLFTTFSLLAIFIASLGLYGLASFTAERRTKEIGIRKVMGARIRDIITLLIWQFSKPVLIANIIAWPISVYAMTSWLESFSYRINNYWLIPICIFAGLMALLIAWITVGGNAYKVARSNPIKALRCE